MKAYAIVYRPVTASLPSKSFLAFVLEGTANPVTWLGGTGQCADLATLNVKIAEKSNNTIVNFSPMITLFKRSDSDGTTQMQFFDSLGFHNFILADSLQVGDKFIINKEGSYWKVAGKSINGVGYESYVTLEGYTPNDVKAYNGIQLRLTRYNDDFLFSGFPWIAKKDNITDYTVQVPRLAAWNTTVSFVIETFAAPVSQALGAAFWAGTEPADTDDPYLDIEDSEPSGPAEGVGYPEDELVPIPDLPSVSVTDTGFVTLFNPTLTQVKNLATYMWAGLFDLNTFKKLFADPMDCILGFNMLPVAIPNGGSAEVVVGNISTGVSMTKAAGQWVELDCGSLDIDKPFGNYLDYSPYMKYSIYLPYIGTVDLSADDIMGHTIHLVYHVDVLSCACVAYLEVDGRVMYQWTGSCGYSIPVTGNDFHQMISNIVSIAATLGGALVSGGMTAPMAAAAAAAGAATATNNVLNSKPDVHRSGSIGSSAGMMGMQKPYLIQQGPRICKPQKQYHYLGYPAFVTVTLGSVSGYQEFSNVILDGIPCTEEERDMIAAACAGGIYL